MAVWLEVGPWGKQSAPHCSSAPWFGLWTGSLGSKRVRPRRRGEEVRFPADPWLGNMPLACDVRSAMKELF